MAYPPPYPPFETVTAHARQEWHSHIQDLLRRARSEARRRAGHEHNGGHR